MADNMDGIESVADFLYQTTDPTDPMQLWEAERYEIQKMFELPDELMNMAMLMFAIAYNRGRDNPKEMPNPYAKPKG